MAIRWWPRSIRWQMLAGLALLEALSIGLFAVMLVRLQSREIFVHAQHRLAHQSDSMALQATEAFEQERPGWVGLSVRMMGEAPSVAFAKITDPAGNVVFVSKGEADQVTLDPVELAQIPRVLRAEARVFSRGGDHWEGVRAIYTGGVLRGYAWVETDPAWDREQLNTVLRGTAIFAAIWILASAVLVLLMASSISRPLQVLHRGTRALMNAPESSDKFPLPVSVQNEIGDLIEAFNRMVASIDEQRAGLSDTLSLLDSMLANAPIGLAFFDRRCRFVRVNQAFAGMTGIPLGRHLGRTLPELLPQPIAEDLERTVQAIFTQGTAVHNVELTGKGGLPTQVWTWLVSGYPVRTALQEVRWVGVMVLDASERKRAEEALRRSEKLAATGRLAASIAHEINNPLEAITNLLFLLSNFCRLDYPALGYVTMAEHEVRRISEITQQTLRFYRQSTHPAHANMSDLIDSVLSLYQGRLAALGIEVERHYDPEMDLFCFAGEVRQVFANLVSNAIDALSGGGRLVVRARRSHSWSDSHRSGVRFTVADTGIGMEAAVRERIFEAFFTTKDVTGTGLGLWVSHEIISKHHGMIHVVSRTGQPGKPSGTVFQIFLPDDLSLAAEQAQTAAAAV